MNIDLNSLATRSKQTNSGKFWYGLGLIIAVLGLIVAVVSNEISTVMPFTGLLVSICLSIGFLATCLPYLRFIWKDGFGRYANFFIHGLSLLLAVIPARLLTADATHLPANYFDVTVALCTWIYYPVIWITVLALILSFLFLLLLLFSVLVKITTIPILSQLIEYSGRFFSTKSWTIYFADNQRRDLAQNLGNHMFGAGSVLALLLLVIGIYFSAMDGLKPAVRWIAYVADFQSSSIYPGIKSGARFRLLDNEIIAYAEHNGREINITVDNYSRSQNKN